MSLSSTSLPRDSVFAADRRATVLNLETFLRNGIDGITFFAENYFTNGMTTLVDRALRHLGGSASGSSIFLLSQAMGGGKTHSMIALGLLAQDPALRQQVLAEKNPAPTLGPCRVIGFNGRDTDTPGGIWGSLADQLDKAEQFVPYSSGSLQAPGPEAWKNLLKEAPTLIFLDELPPYLEYAAAVPIGNADLARVTTAALANLFVAVADMDNVCLVLSDLAGTNFTIGQANIQAAVERATQNITNEARRLAVPITPVNPNGDELYHILRKRLFSEIAPQPEIERIATAYAEALSEAKRMGLTTTEPNSLHKRVLDAYPFHPDLRELVGKFKENDGFQQTRGVIRLMQILVSQLWESKRAEETDLIHLYDLDFNNDEIASELRSINDSLSEAIAHDLAHSGDAEVEQIDQANGNRDASDAAKLILVASLSTAPGAIQGLREFQLIDALQRPGRDLSTFKPKVLDKLGVRAWYLHTASDGRLYFKNQQNLAAKLRSTAQSLHNEVVNRMLREHLESYFQPSLRDCYQVVKVLPAPDEVQLDLDKTTLIIARPSQGANQLPISEDWQNWWSQQQYKNRVLFLSGTRDIFQSVLDSARQVSALKSIQRELESQKLNDNDPQWKALDALHDRTSLQFTAALKEAFDQIVYPSINTALRATNVDLAFAGNQSGEGTIRHTLEDAQKFTTKVADNDFRLRAENRLFGGSSSKTVLWADFKRAAATSTNWPLHKPGTLEELRDSCFQRDLWREEGNYLRRGPFAPPNPEVAIRVLSSDDTTGVNYLKIEPLHAEKIVFETGDNDPTPASGSVPTPQKFEAKGLQYRFLAIDEKDPSRVSEVKTWIAPLFLKYRLHSRGDHYELELHALPANNNLVIRYTTDGSSPTSSAAATYNGPFRVPDACRVVNAIAIAPNLKHQSNPLNIPIADLAKGPQIDAAIPATWDVKLRFDSQSAVWNFLATLQASPNTKAYDIFLTVEGDTGSQILEYTGSHDTGYDSAAIGDLAKSLQALIPENDLRLQISSLSFPTGQSLLDFVKQAGLTFQPEDVSQ